MSVTRVFANTAPAQHIYSLYLRCEDCRKQVISLTEKVDQEQYERRQLKAEMEESCQKQLDELRRARAYYLRLSPRTFILYLGHCFATYFDRLSYTMQTVIRPVVKVVM